MKADINDAVIEALAKIGNHEKVMKLCEPDIMEPLELKKWMVRRTIKALELLRNEFMANKR